LGKCDPDQCPASIRPAKRLFEANFSALKEAAMGKWLLVVAAVLLGAAAPAFGADRSSPEGREVLEIYRSIVEIPTVKGRGQVPKMAKYLAARFRKAGFARRDIEILPVGETAGLIVTYRGSGEKAPILFLAHMDVVEAKREDWQRDPFSFVEENGYFYGRGTSDIKAGVAQLTEAFLQLKRQGFKPDRDLIIAFSGDEETDMLSTRAMATKLAARRPEFAINSDSGGGRLDAAGKGLSFGVQVAEKTYANIEVTVHNPGGHSARPRTDNAIYELAELLGNIRSYRFAVVVNDLTRSIVRDAVRQPGANPALEAALTTLATNPEDPQAQALLANDPRLGNSVRTTCVPTLLSGGHADNALPQKATANINCRVFPGVPVESVRQKLAELGRNPNAEWKVVGTPMESPPSPPNAELFSALAGAFADRYPGIPVIPYMTPGATDGKHYRAAGIPTYGANMEFSRAGEDTGAHGLNEREPVDSFFESLDFWPRLMRLLAS
jgi:acetylornithine deacetylase/succinyl-diaminopimelate desuccinylase-like protein